MAPTDPEAETETETDGVGAGEHGELGASTGTTRVVPPLGGFHVRFGSAGARYRRQRQLRVRVV